MIADRRGRLHLVYADQASPGPPVGAYYQRSDDGGATWSGPRLFDGYGPGYDGNYGPAYPNVVAVGEDEIHVVWDGRPLGQRWHKWSADGGLSWTAPEQVNDFQRGLTIPNALAVDSAGVLHLITLGWLDFGLLPSGAFHTSWQAGSWSPLETISQMEWAPEAPNAAVALGNELVAVWHNLNEERLEIWTTSIVLDAPRLPAAAPPEPTAEPTALPAGPRDEGEVASVATLAPPLSPVTSAGRPVTADTGTVILISSAAVLVILGAAVAARLRARGRPGSH
jgi:hypothetical protein